MRVNVLMRGAKCKNAHFIAKMPHFIAKTAFSVQKTGKVSDWYQSDNYL